MPERKNQDRRTLTVGDLIRLLETADPEAEVWAISQGGIFYEIEKLMLDTNPDYPRTNHLIEQLHKDLKQGNVFLPRSRMKKLDAGKFIILAGGPEKTRRGFIKGLPDWDEL